MGLTLRKNLDWITETAPLAWTPITLNLIIRVVVDLDESPNSALFYNLEGKSFSNTAQVQLDYELIKFLDLRIAYRWTQVETQYRSGRRQQPLTPKHRYLINLAYETKSSLKKANWLFDLTMQWRDQQRIPDGLTSDLNAREIGNSPSYGVVNAQITRNFNQRWAVYVGVENLFDYQTSPIVGSSNPFDQGFDASQVWGPIFGRMIYAGLRWADSKGRLVTINNKAE